MKLEDNFITICKGHFKLLREDCTRCKISTLNQKMVCYTPIQLSKQSVPSYRKVNEVKDYYSAGQEREK